MGKVNRCICSNIGFEKVKAIAEKKNLRTVEDLRKREICSCHCMLCVPYIEKMLETGKTEYEPTELIKKPTNRQK